MSKIPVTRIHAPLAQERSIREAVRRTHETPDGARLARLDDTDALLALLSDPTVSDPIYTLPRPINRKTVKDFISRHLDERARGEGLLLVGLDGAEAAATYHDIQFWPQWSACELGGAIRADKQNAGAGVAGAAAAFGWLFEGIGVDLICETAALDNFRTKRLLERLGFSYAGEIESELPGGGTRASLCWEMTKADWRSQNI